MPTPDSQLTLAVAGSRKTQGLVEACAAAEKDQHILVLTYTQNNQIELANRLATIAGDHPHVEVRGWFSFLLNDFVRPFLPLLFPGRRLEGFDFNSPPQTYAAANQWQRYFNEHAEARRVHLPQLAVRINQVGPGACIRRLERIYDRILIDEVQDLCGYDLEILSLLIRSRIALQMVGDIRQAIIATNQREAKHKQFMYLNIWNWFRAEQRAGRISIVQRRETWRCAPEIAAFADSLFAPEWGFEPTISRNRCRTGHDGVFLVAPADVMAYHATYTPLLLRHNKNSATQYGHLGCMNFGDSKGIERPRILIYPTARIREFITDSKPLDAQQAARLYVAVTRAQHSVGIIMDYYDGSRLSFWTPETHDTRAPLT